MCVYLSLSHLIFDGTQLFMCRVPLLKVNFVFDKIAFLVPFTQICIQFNPCTISGMRYVQGESCFISFLYVLSQAQFV